MTRSEEETERTKVPSTPQGAAGLLKTSLLLVALVVVGAAMYLVLAPQGEPTERRPESSASDFARCVRDATPSQYHVSDSDVATLHASVKNLLEVGPERKRAHTSTTLNQPLPPEVLQAIVDQCGSLVRGEPAPARMQTPPPPSAPPETGKAVHESAAAASEATARASGGKQSSGSGSLPTQRTPSPCATDSMLEAVLQKLSWPAPGEFQVRARVHADGSLTEVSIVPPAPGVDAQLLRKWNQTPQSGCSEGIVRSTHRAVSVRP